MDDKVLVDGGIFSTVSMGDPITRCREEEGPDVDIIVDLILCYETIEHQLPELELEETRWMTAGSLYNRRKKITDYYFWKEDIVRMERSASYDDIQFRLVVMPSENLTNGGFVPVNASAEDVQNEISVGY